MQRVLIVLLVSAAAWSCAAKSPDAARQAAALRSQAEAKVLAGCYDCLLEARDIYAGLAVGRNRPPLILRLFEVELLLALREKELAMDPSATVARARALMPELPALADGARLIALVDGVPPDGTGVSAADDVAFRRSRADFIARVDDELAWLATEGPVLAPVRQYLSLAIDCSYLRRRRPAGQPAREPVMQQIAADAPALLTYRVGLCDDIKRNRLERARAVEPRYAEAAYFLARLELATAQKTGGRAARPLLAEAYARFSRSPAVTYLNGNFQQLIGDCKAALRFYDETIALTDGHENARLGRTVCFTFLKAPAEAIAEATHLITIKAFNMSDAYYWRAWNWHSQRQLEPARADIEDAKRLASNNAIHRLAGIIEHDQNDLTAAEKDLVAAKSMTGGSTDCVARWYLGLVEMKRERWTESAAHFEDAMTCYERSAEFSEASLRAMEANTDVDPDFKASQIAGFQAAIQEDRAQQYASAFNAANHYARGGNAAKAKALLEVAAKDPSLAARVAELRRILGGGGFLSE